jgi:hypothetical protein
LSFNKHTGWTLKAHLRHGDWQTLWASYGLTDATTTNPATTVTISVVVLAGDWGFATDRSLNYTATAHKTGLAR